MYYRNQKVAVDKQKVSELGRTRPSQLETVHALMAKTLSQMGGVKKSGPRGAPKSRGQALLDLISKSNTTANGLYKFTFKVFSSVYFYIFLSTEI